MAKTQKKLQNTLAQLVYEAEHGPGPERVEEARQHRLQQRRICQLTVHAIREPPALSTLLGAEVDDEEIEQTEINHQRYYNMKDTGEDIPFIIQSRTFGGLLSPFIRFFRPVDVPLSDPVTQHWQPYASRLWSRLISILPRFIYRTVHSDSAGEVVLHEDGSTEFRSEQYRLNGSPTKFADFDKQYHQKDIARHLRGVKEPTHLVSFTDSLDYALYLCHRAYCRKRTRDVFVYVVDTHKLLEPCMMMSMYCAVKAYAVRLRPVWLDKMFAYSSLTEYVCWDSLRASSVEKIDYAFLMASGKDSLSFDPLFRTSCAELFPDLIAAAKFKDSRSNLHSKMYITPVERLDIERYKKNPWIHQKGERMDPPIAMAKVLGPRMTDVQIQRIFNLVTPYQNKATLLLGILSMCVTRFDPEHLPELVVAKYPQLIRSLLDTVSGETADGVHRSVLVYQAAATCCPRRIDVNTCEKFIESCVLEWDKTAKPTDPCYHALPVFIVRGQYRAARNLMRYQKVPGSSNMLNMSSYMDEEAVPVGSSSYQNHSSRSENHRYGGLKLGTVSALNLAAVLRYGTRVRQEETDEQIEARLRRDYPDRIFYGPESKDGGERTAKRRKVSATTPSSVVRPASKASEERLLRIKRGGSLKPNSSSSASDSTR